MIYSTYTDERFEALVENVTTANTASSSGTSATTVAVLSYQSSDTNIEWVNLPRRFAVNHEAYRARRSRRGKPPRAFALEQVMARRAQMPTSPRAWTTALKNFVGDLPRS